MLCLVMLLGNFTAFAEVSETPEALDLWTEGSAAKRELIAYMEDARKQVNSELATYEQIAIVKLYPHEFEKTPKKSIKRFLYTSMV